ncbi:MAG: hypothetical protein JWR19_1143 [Pedosphaera sp.]|nr:hypothetical protein [Pedosphaera sp.]
MNRRFLKQVILFGLLYYLIFLALNGVIFLISHIPPKAVNLDHVALGLYAVEHALAAPRFLLRRLWPGEATPIYFQFLIALCNCLLWGFALAGLKALWTKVRT